MDKKPKGEHNVNGFREYQGRPVVRLAYRIKEGDTIVDADEGKCRLTSAEGMDITFAGDLTDIQAGDYVSHLDDYGGHSVGEALYHCPACVFADRSVVESEPV